MLPFMANQQVNGMQVLSFVHNLKHPRTHKKEAPQGGALQAIGKNLIMLRIGLTGCGFTMKTSKGPFKFQLKADLFIPNTDC